MKRQGIWVGGVRWQNGHYQSINKRTKIIKSARYSLSDVHIDVEFDIRYCLE